MVPGNLTFIEFQWEAMEEQDEFMVRATADDAVYHFHLQVECTGKRFCTKQLPKNEWLEIGRQHAGQSVSFEVFAAKGESISVSKAIDIRFAPEPLFGALYYWASVSETIKRVSFGSERAVDFIIPGENVDYECVACHSVSRDGSTIAFAVGPDEGENATAIQVTSTLDPDATSIAPTKGESPYPKRHVHQGDWDGIGPD